VKCGLIWMGVFGGTQIWFWVSNLMMLVVSYVEVLEGNIPLPFM
jgi:hypothetical protein